MIAQRARGAAIAVGGLAALALPAPVPSSAQLISVPPDKGTLQGVVFVGPYCESTATGRRCRHGVLKAPILVESLVSRRVVRSSKRDGRFRLGLRPGRYRITARLPRSQAAGPLMVPPPLFVTIVAGQTTPVILDYFVYKG